jgi:hypothetical protein
VAAVALVAAAPSAECRKAGRCHAWDRDVGRRVAGLTLSERDFPPQYLFRDVPADPSRLTAHLRALHGRDGITVTCLLENGPNDAVYRVDLPALRQGAGRAATRPIRVGIGSGIHRDEPVGPATAEAFLGWARGNKDFRRRFQVTLVVKVSPDTTPLDRTQLDVNRSFAKGKWIPETDAIRRSLAQEKLDLFVDLHGSGSGAEGYWLIRGKDDGTMSRRILSSMKTTALWDVAPDRAKVQSEFCRCNFLFHALGGITSDSSGTFKSFMAGQGVPYSYTLETPRNLSPPDQVRGALKLLRSAMYNVARHGSRPVPAGHTI